MVDVPLHPSKSFGRRRHVGLSCQPCRDAIRGCRLPLGLGFPIPTQGCTEHWSFAGYGFQPLLQQFVGPRQEAIAVGGVDPAFGQDIFLKGIEPSIKDIP